MATEAVGRFRAEQYRFVTTNFTLAELHALLLSRVNRQVALATLKQIDTSGITTIVRVRQRDEMRARAIVTHFDDKDFSLIDAISFAVMEASHCTAVMSFDHDFVTAGFRLWQP